jgi:hypothetical protein
MFVNSALKLFGFDIVEGNSCFVGRGKTQFQVKARRKEDAIHDDGQAR